ncbi:MAG: hypothetical protein JNK89_09590 [Saprospiraceae bacterium]|nr:hypothetical protein [Saprospiraceae bacterium]
MRSTIILALIFSSIALAAQQPSPLAVPALDTLGPQAASTTTVFPEASRPGLWKRIWTKDYPNPRTAAFLSLALPGAGQAYNKQWWKMPMVDAVLGGLTYVALGNISEYRRLRDNYRWVVDGDPDTNPTEFPYNQLDATSLKQYRDQWRRYVEQSSLALGLAYILTATEAFVGAHLSRFDVSDDLSFKLQPHFQASPDTGPVFGLGLSVRLGKP